MKDKKLIALIPFIILVILDTIAVAISNQAWHQILKPLLMPALALWFVYVSQHKNHWYLLAFFCSFLGDVFLLFDDFFVLGIASFLMTHLFFMVAILKFVRQKSFAHLAPLAIPFLIYFSLIVFLVYPNVGSLLVPVIIYGLVIASFGTVSLANYLQNKTKADRLLLIGAFLFILSDSFIAIDKFYQAHIIYQILVISLYCIAQYCIAFSLWQKFDQKSYAS